MIKYNTYWTYRTMWPSKYSDEKLVLGPNYLYKTKKEALSHIHSLQKDYEYWRTHKYEIIKVQVPIPNLKNFKTIKYKENKNENNQ